MGSSRPHAPGGKPASNVAATRYGREVIEFPEQASLRKPLEDAETEARTANSSARQTQRRVTRSLMTLDPAACACRIVQLTILAVEYLIEGERLIEGGRGRESC